MTTRRLLTGGMLTAVLLFPAACGDTARQTPAGDQRIADCDELSEEAADLVVAAADHAASIGGGLPPAAFEAGHPEDVGQWELVATLADGSGDLEARVAAASDAAERLGCPPGPLHDTIDARVKEALAERGEQLSEEFDRDQHTAMNLMAIASAAFQPAPSSSADLPPGFPAEFPVHPKAQRVDAGIQPDGSVTATWEVQERFGAVADFYLDALQEGRLGGWDVGSSQSSETGTVEGGSTGRQRLEITGYDFVGEIEVASEAAGQVTVTATLTPQD